MTSSIFEKYLRMHNVKLIQFHSNGQYGKSSQLGVKTMWKSFVYQSIWFVEFKRNEFPRGYESNFKSSQSNAVKILTAKPFDLIIEQQDAKQKSMQTWKFRSRVTQISISCFNRLLKMVDFPRSHHGVSIQLAIKFHLLVNEFSRLMRWFIGDWANFFARWHFVQKERL